MTAKESGEKLVAQNKKARHLYEFLEKYEAGMVLVGSEVKSLRAGRISFKDGYVRITGDEAFLTGVHIAPYENAGYAGHEPERPRKLLLHAAEIRALRAKVEQKGLTVVPVRVY
ncbi:SsrA-binding protein SmpB, partial [Solidesulfovibrio sp.]|uniref:SsrA-binding protein SmpB n=1 Tax=Solidesulfovibrio sp. TaxID=2910990 RepID=UPI00261F9B86